MFKFSITLASRKNDSYRFVHSLAILIYDQSLKYITLVYLDCQVSLLLDEKLRELDLCPVQVTVSDIILKFLYR